MTTTNIESAKLALIEAKAKWEKTFSDEDRAEWFAAGERLQEILLRKRMMRDPELAHKIEQRRIQMDAHRHSINEARREQGCLSSI